MIKTRDYLIVKGVRNHASNCVSLPRRFVGRKIKQIWRLLDEEDFLTRGQPVGFENAFLDNVMHDWQQRGNNFVYYAASSQPGEVVDVLVIFKEIER